MINRNCTKTIANINCNVWQLIILKILKLKPNLWKLENGEKIKLPFEVKESLYYGV